jgi:PII-like signaling protein
MVRIYITEGDHQYKRLMALLHDEEKVCGVTAFRGIAGFGKSGEIHSSTLLDMSLDLPLILEFFDRPEKAAQVLRRLRTMIKPGHLVSWCAHANTGE